MAKQKLKILIIVAGLLLSILSIVGCGGQKNNTVGQNQQNVSKQGETINLLTQKHPWTTAIEPFIPEFEKETGIKVNMQILTEQQTRDKSLMTLQAKSPDIDVWMSLKSYEGLAYAKAGFYEPLDKYVNDPNLTPPDYKFNDFMKGPLEGEKIEGKLVGIPIIVEGPVVFYRKDLFTKYNIPLPKTLDDLVSIARTIQEKTNGEVYGVALRGLPPAVCYTFGPFFHNMGLEWLDSNGKPNFDKPQAIKAIELYATLAGKYGPPGVVNNTFYQSTSLFTQGKVAMEIDASNELATIIDPKSSRVVENVGVIPIPPGPGGDHPTVLQWGISISAFSQHKEAAWKFVRWATSPEMQLRLALKGIASPRASVWENAEFKKSLAEPVRQEWASALKVIMEKGNPQVGPPAVKQAEVRKIIGEAIDKAILSQATPTQVAQEIQQKLVEVLKQQ
ncbi:Bacterial extracellular solute-binding, family 1 [Moorella glycerini]|uniref:ABC transporter-binding protein n=1 Tax=Neomoorella stamsii TaxID=1266720 RepID=A0A9X7J6G9_9FIRM|nr:MULTISPECIES: sugar ABC transporter substrate-binding protein [Moorella]PRR77549.1 putative ABC transporter-binding protein precursor [Moorella stamsii]CEP69404.1 Bacterial extracellular solute-binding, family 1 [Moorella glycerini]